jgi:sortase A
MTAVQDRVVAPPPVVPPPRRRGRFRRPRGRPVRKGSRRTRSPLEMMVAWGLAALSLLTAWFVFYTLIASSLQHGHDQAVLYSQLREGLATATTPIGGQITPGKPVALLDMPSAGLRNEVIVEGTAPRDLMNGPGHKRDTPLPGQAGYSQIFGRAKLFGGPFHRVPEAQVGDVITVTTGEGIAKYVVARVRHTGDPFLPPLAAGKGRLTLVTSESGGWRSGWAPSRAVFVDAMLQGEAFPTPPGRLSYVPDAEAAMGTDAGALFVLVLWLPVLIIGAVAVVWAMERWGRWQTWIVGVPVILAGLWGVSQTAAQLLPNLM